MITLIQNPKYYSRSKHVHKVFGVSPHEQVNAKHKLFDKCQDYKLPRKFSNKYRSQDHLGKTRDGKPNITKMHYIKMNNINIKL